MNLGLNVESTVPLEDSFAMPAKSALPGNWNSPPTTTSDTPRLAIAMTRVRGGGENSESNDLSGFNRAESNDAPR